MMATKNVRAFDCETTGVESHEVKILGWSDCVNGNVQWNTVDTPVFEDGDFIVAHNGKYDANVLWHNYGIKLEIGYDTMLAEFVLHIDKEKKLEKVLKRRFKINKDDLFALWKAKNPQAFIVQATGKAKKNPPASLPDKWWETSYKTLANGTEKLVHHGVELDELGKYAMEDVEYLFKIMEQQEKEFEAKPELKEWFYNVEMPFCNLLIKSEQKGVFLDTDHLHNMSLGIKRRRDALELQLRQWAGNLELNLNSSKQMQEVLYEKFAYPKKKVWRTKSGGYATSKEVYAAMAPTNLFARKMLEFNELDDLLVKFIDPLPLKVDSEGRIHCNYNQTGTKTRRMSSSNPNLQQIPSRTELGKEVRAAFRAAPEYKFLTADYDQVEIRIAAHFTGDEKLIDAILNAEFDVHTCTAADMFNLHPKDVTKKQRDVGKLINFSIFYGKSAYGFAKDWNCSEREAQEKIDLWFSKRPRVKEWINEQKMHARKTGGWVKTLAGLPLYIGDVHTKDTNTLDGVLRRAVNFPIQGSSQDIIKKACVVNYNELDVVPLLFVHDEVVYELHESVLEDAQKLGGVARGHVSQIIENMENVYKLKVPLKVSWHISDYWRK